MEKGGGGALFILCKSISGVDIKRVVGGGGARNINLQTTRFLVDKIRMVCYPRVVSQVGVTF